LAKVISLSVKRLTSINDAQADSLRKVEHLVFSGDPKPLINKIRDKQDHVRAFEC